MTKPGPEESRKEKDDPVCFVIMPISDPDGYVKGHFKHVYDDILAPACDRAGFTAVRADTVKQSNLIHLDILQKLLDAPMAICDLSSRNPNVLFELALRQAFDKPVALAQEVGTPPVFDISPFRYTEYRKERTYHEVLEDQANIANAVRETFNTHRTGKGVNSIVKLLALSAPAAIPEINAPEASANIQQLILSELSQLRAEVRDTRRNVSARRMAFREEASARLINLHQAISEAEEYIQQHPRSPEQIMRARSMFHNCHAMWSALAHGQAELAPGINEKMTSLGRRMELLDFELRRTSEGIPAEKETDPRSSRPATSA
jgi:hypothetical protein